VRRKETIYGEILGSLLKKKHGGKKTTHKGRGGHWGGEKLFKKSANVYSVLNWGCLKEEGLTEGSKAKGGLKSQSVLSNQQKYLNREKNDVFGYSQLTHCN